MCMIKIGNDILCVITNCKTGPTDSQDPEHFVYIQAT